MIAGNEEKIILRCLESAREAFDELCLVIAVGSMFADKTAYRAEKWCSENGKDFRCVGYANQEDFPHVDDFGAARNLSFSLARHEWLLWLDCDDYLDAVNCARIREVVSVVDPDVNAIFATYCIEKQGAEIMRERLIRNGKGRWKNPIHETCVVEGKIVNCPQLHIYHSDHGHKHESSARRNIAILNRTLEDAPRHYFYLHSDLKASGDKAGSLAAGKAALALLGENQPEEKYVVRLNLSELEPDCRENHLLEAIKLQPHRREALAYLCQVCLNEGRVSDAVSYFRMLDALPLPSPLPWTHQGIWYGWARNFLWVRVQRACGKTELADAKHAELMNDPDYAKGFAAYEHSGGN